MRSGNGGNHPVATLLATGLGLFMIYLDATIVNVALPDIQREFQVGEQGLQWVVAAYSLTMGMFIMSTATLADMHGRRRLFVIGVVIFAVASVLCGAAPNIVVLNIARGLQGVGAATVNVASLALVSAAYPDPAAKAKAIGMWTGIAAVGLAVGPTLGGLMTEHIGWRSIFAVNVVIGLLAVVLVYRYVAESRDPSDRGLDPVGQVLFLVGIGALTYALIEAPQRGWVSPLIVGLFAASLVVAVAFVLAELRQPEPMMDVRVFRDRVYSTAIFTIFTVLFGIYGMMLVVTQFFQNVEGYSPEKAGVLMLATSIPTVVLAPFAGRLAARFGGRRPTLAGMVCMVSGLTLMGVGVMGSLPVVLVSLALIGAAGGLAIAPVTSVAMSSVPAERAGMASGIMSAQRAIGSTAGFAIMGSILAAVVASTLPGKLDAVVTDPAESRRLAEQIIDEANPRAVPSLIGPGKPLPTSTAVETTQLEQAAEDAFEDGMRVALFAGGALAAAALLAGLVVFPRGEAEDAEDELDEAAALRADEAAPETTR